MGSIRMLVNIVVIWMITNVNCLLNPKCPPSDLLQPCYCEQDKNTHELIPEVIYCGGSTPLELQTIMRRLSSNLTINLREFPAIYINNTAITHLEDDIFGDIGFSSIYIHAKNLREIKENAFRGRTNSTTNYLELGNNPRLQNVNNSLFIALSKLEKLGSLSLFDANITEIPDNAFENGPKGLSDVHINGKNIRKFGENAFKRLERLKSLKIVNTSISFIPNEAFIVNNAQESFIGIAMYENYLLTGNSFAPKSLINIKRRADLLLSHPSIRSNNLTFLAEKAFLPFLLAHSENTIEINDQSFNCSDARNQWLIQSKHLSQVHFTHCRPKVNRMVEEYDEEWQQFKLVFGKIYSNSGQEMKRKSIFINNLKRIKGHNIEFKKGLKSYEMAVNKFTDLHSDEILTKAVPRLITKQFNKYSQQYITNSTDNIPKQIDWRDKNAVTSVKDQNYEMCGSCYGQVAAAAIEGQMAIKHGKLVSLSSQNLIDCTVKYGNLGCRGGLIEWAFDYIIENGGIDTEESYPYRAQIQSKCYFSNETVGARITGYVELPSGDEEALKKAVALIGPIAVAVDTIGGFAGSAFLSYKSGVYFEELCSNLIENFNHVMVVVGYGTTPEGQDYWLLKNSFGTKWGENGYIRWARNRNNMCGVATSPSYPTGVH